MEDLCGQIAREYGLAVAGLHPVPRGFCAEAYRLETAAGPYFVKAFSNPRFAANLPRSLDCQARLAQAVDFVPAPLPTADGRLLFTAADGRVVSLYTYIEGAGCEPKDDLALVSLLARVYRSGVATSAAEDFSFQYERHYDDFWRGRLKLSPAVAACVQSRIEDIRAVWRAHVALCRRLRGAGGGFVLTHGDAPGNLMADNDGKLYLVDWDDACMAPPERDLWFILGGGEKIAPVAAALQAAGIRWNYNRDCYNYYLYTRLLNDLFDFMELDLLGQADGGWLCAEIERDIFGWLLPLVR